MALEITPDQKDWLISAYYLWLTTVRPDGMPQPTPIWFVWQDDSILIYSRPEAQKLKNIHANPKVALNFNRDADAEDFIVIMGEAVIDTTALPSHLNLSYVEKYADGIKDLKWTPEQMSGMFSVAIRVTPLKIRIGA